MKFFHPISNLPLEPVSTGIQRFIFTLKEIMGVYYEIQPGILVSEHRHPNEQMGMLIQGKVKWKIRGEEIITQAPVLYSIPFNEPHSAEVLGDEPALFLDVFYPKREDFLKGGPVDYMQDTSPKQEK